MQDQAEFRNFLDVMRRRRAVLVQSLLGAICVALVYLVLAKPTYEAESLILVDQAQKNLLAADPLRSVLPADNAYVESEVEILRSPALALAVVNQANLRDDPEYGPGPAPLDWALDALGVKPLAPETEFETQARVLDRFLDHRSIERRGLTYVIAIKVRADTPVRAAELTNMLAGLYVETQVDQKIAKSLEARDILKAQIETATTAVQDARAELDRINAQEQLELLAARLSDLETQSNLQVADSRIISPALPPLNPSGPSAAFVMLLALVGGVILGCSLVYISEVYEDGVTSAEQLADLVDAATAVTVPNVRGRARGHGAPWNLVVHRPLSPYSDAIRRLRASVDRGFSDTAQDAPAQAHVILVASSVPGEGKTALALSLARVYALDGVQTLLIDADFRHPSVHEYAGTRTEVGLADFLRAPDQHELPVLDDPKTDLAVMPGKRDAQLATDDLVRSRMFGTILSSARRNFEVIIIDSPPMMPVADARYLAGLADTVLFSVQYASTRRPVVRTAVRELMDAMPDTANMVTVLNRHQVFRPEYGDATDHKVQGFSKPTGAIRVEPPNA